MKKSKFTESQIVQALKEHEAGKNVDDICRQLGINRNTLYNCKELNSTVFISLDQSNEETSK